MKPYYTEPGIEIYHGDWKDIICEISEPTEDSHRHISDLLLTDPPYGIGADRNLMANTQFGKAATKSKDYGLGKWDKKLPFEDLEWWLNRTKNQIIFGGNYYPMPLTKCWIVWDKENGENGYADFEMAWTNLDKACRMFRFRWMGMLQGNMKEKELRFHPTQKPTELMRWCLNLVPEANTVIDPFMGSGTTLRAAKDLGRKAIGIEIEEKYCEIAVKRLRQEVLPGI